VSVALSREQVVRTAVALLDEVGLEGLTLRRLATELGVSAPTLYWHVRDKRELLDLMAVAILAEAQEDVSHEPREHQPWWDWLGERTTAQFQALRAHRDSALVLAGNRPTEDALPVAEKTIATLVSVGFPVEEALGVMLTLGHYVIGCVVEYQAEDVRARPDLDEALVRRLEESDDLPLLRSAVAAHRRPGPHTAGSFEHGLHLLVSGLRVRRAELTGEPLETGTPAVPASAG
jgi:TetR/AcrR family transcriptional regulator, tetracycline repressor protein